MSRPNAISRLLSGIRREPHQFRPSTMVFADLNVERIASDLMLQEKGAQRGKKDEPPSGTETMDDVEHQIAERVEAEKRAAHALYVEHLDTYAERLTGLDFESRFNDIQQAAPQAVGDFRAERARARDELFGLRRRLFDAEQERTAFKNRNRLDRAARPATAAKLIFKTALLLLMFVIEVALNGVFLAKGNELGLLGGAVQAVMFAILNVFVSFGVGVGPARQLLRPSILAKAFGLVVVLGYLAFALFLNLCLAHYREVSGELSTEVGLEVMRRVMSAPLHLVDMNSWLFFATGFAFSLLAIIDGFYLLDPFPGYGAVEERCRAAQDLYTERKGELIEELQDIRDRATEAMNESARDLAVRRGEYDSILQARSRLSVLFSAHQDQLETAAIALLTIYREANRAARTTPAPAHFARGYALARIPPQQDTDEKRARDDLRERIAASDAVLKDQAAAIHAEFEAAVASYRQIDDMLPESDDASPKLKAA